jgi:hypothetical protein
MITINVNPKQLMLAALVGSVLACGRVPGQFSIVNNQIPLDGCVIPTNETIYQGSGVLDLSLVTPGALTAYMVFPLLRNDLEGAASGVDTNEIHLRSFAIDVSLRGPPQPETQALFDRLASDDPMGLAHFKMDWSGSVRSGGGEISAAVTAFRTELATLLLGTQEIGLSPSLGINLRIRAFGRTTVSDIESDPFDFPISVCVGCLVANLQPCPYTTAAVNQGNACNVAQDEPVDCCVSGNDLLCPPPVVSK